MFLSFFFIKKKMEDESSIVMSEVPILSGNVQLILQDLFSP